MKTIIITIFLLIFYINTAISQTFLEYVVNEKWKGTGMLMENPALFKMDWGKTLKDQFYKLEFQNEFTINGNKVIFLATGFYKIIEDSKITGSWMDSQGNVYKLDGEVSKNKLSINWKTLDKSVGKTVYTLLTNNTIKVIDYSMRDGKKIKFAEAKYNSGNN